MNFFLKLGIAVACLSVVFTSCKKEKTKPSETKEEVTELKKESKTTTNSKVVLKAHSKTPNFLKLTPEFSGVKIYPVLSSEDKLGDFVYGSMADGNGLLKNIDGTYSLMNNIEAHYSVVRIRFDETFKPISGEYVLNQEGSGGTAQCSGTLVTPEEHGFGPLYLSGGEWDRSSKGVQVTDPLKPADSASVGRLLPALGEWSVENAVPLNKNAYADKTVVLIGDDTGTNDVPSGQLGMYVGNRGDLEGGKLYGLKVTDNITYEVEMKEGQSYNAEFIELKEKEFDLLDAECRKKGVMGFSRVEDIDYRRGSAKNNREFYFCVTGRKAPDLVGKGTLYGRVYKVELNENDPTGACKITCILDGDLENGKARMFHSPDNIVVTENYAYIQEDPNGYFGKPSKNHYASLYQYNLNTGALKKVLECDQVTAMTKGYGKEKEGHHNNIKSWEISGMTDISDVIGVEGTFLFITQNHGWESDDFIDPNSKYTGGEDGYKTKEGSVLHVIHGLER